MHLSPADFEKAVHEALDGLPAEFRTQLDAIAVDVEDRPTAETARSLDVPRDELLGAYFGTPLTDRGVEDGPQLPDRIVLYQRNLEAMCRTRAELVHEIGVTVLHELGHHFGLDEDELEEHGFG